MAELYIEQKIEALERRVAELERQHQDDEPDHDAPIYAITDGALWSPSPHINPVDFMQSPNSGGAVKDRTLIVVHYTAGRGFSNTTNWFLNDAADVSSHFLISKMEDDPLRQFVDTRRRAWHVGKSEWKGEPSCNGYALGIELDNAGPLQADGTNRWDEPAVGVVDIDGKLWEEFPDHQIEKTSSLIRAMALADPDIGEVIGHQDCATPAGRKIDPGPAFPWAVLAEQLEGTGLVVAHA